jgi:arsenate reductase
VPVKLLYLCTHNRCRSILAEAITNHLSPGRIEARSAGSQPAGEVHPLSLKYLGEAGVRTDCLRSKSWHECESWNPDVVVTMCDSAAAEPCPLWLGDIPTVHWGLADPSSSKGDQEQVADEFRQTIAILTNRVQRLLARDIEHLDEQGLVDCLREMGEKHG